MRLIFLPEVIDYFNDLITILYKKDYFGFEENAIKYVDELLEDINTTLSVRVSKEAPPYFSRYGNGMRYAVFQKNKSTQWYVFFTKYKVDGETIYMVRHITNNHVSAQYL